jgi:hypothetical protein
MNERIIALAKECGLCDEDGDFYGAKPQNYEQFAELIVRECAGLFEIGWGDEKLTGNDASRAVKKHFGVDN